MPSLGPLQTLRTTRAPIRYMIGVLIGIAAFAVIAMVNPAMDRPSSSPLFAATLLIAWLVGFGPAVAVAAVGVVAIDRLGAASLQAWRPDIRDMWWMLVFGITVLGMAWLASAVRQLQDERDNLLAREHGARLEAEAANRAKDEFLAIVSHELRNPLTAILGWLSVLRRGGLRGGDADRALATIERNTMIQTRLIDDLLDVSRATNGKLKVERRPVDLSAVVDHAVHVLQPHAQAAKLAVETDVEPNLSIDGDEPRLQQVVINLVSNAIKFTPPGGSIGIKARRGADSVRLSVVDSGVGIDAHAIHHIFERFYQDTGTPARREGLGLGLAIAKHIVELHGGVIAAHSAGPGRGASFTVTLPVND